MKIIKLDGTMLCSMHREENGQLNLYFQPNSHQLKAGEIKEKSVSELDLSNVKYKIEISKKETLVAFVKSALSFLDRHEFVEVISNPSTFACWSRRETKRRNKNGKKAN